ncbi:hypothetical protein PGT21_022739 [Puccinia graminis f. sp. tritici]|uniref:Uncharacterized protein n=1 Tax=Puccinia graminis f. sp. tritici TaxID=56615 RepID=A0A5B0NTU9_PUCGR|nr:hypothetical protein PGT21_022739 [Puccinia graminis f. sp. tritici]KAA1092353.1 hypothetical protein PGTUg99_022343 [Puccinia graminis f. sp. tritici]
MSKEPKFQTAQSIKQRALLPSITLSKDRTSKTVIHDPKYLSPTKRDLCSVPPRNLMNKNAIEIERAWSILAELYSPHPSGIAVG